MICWYCNQVFWDGKGQVKCKIDGRVIPGPIYSSKKPCNCPLDKQPQNNAWLCPGCLDEIKGYRDDHCAGCGKSHG